MNLASRGDRGFSIEIPENVFLWADGAMTRSCFHSAHSVSRNLADALARVRLE